MEVQKQIKQVNKSGLTNDEEIELRAIYTYIRKNNPIAAEIINNLFIKHSIWEFYHINRNKEKFKKFVDYIVYIINTTAISPELEVFNVGFHHIEVRIIIAVTQNGLFQNNTYVPYFYKFYYHEKGKSRKCIIL